MASRKPNVVALQRLVFLAGACLVLVGLLTGFWAAAVLTDMVSVPLPRLALAAHINALLGGFWCVGVAATLSHVHYGDLNRRRLCALTVTASSANWLITLVASILGVRGLSFGGSTANDVIAALLQALVVIPSLAAATMWVVGLARRR